MAKKTETNDTPPESTLPMAPPPPKAKPIAKVELMPVAELAKVTGHTLRLDFPKRRVIPDALHAAAATMHGWNDHQHHAGKPMRLSREDYELAIEAAARGTAPHMPAVSPHCQHAFARAQEK